ncbi:MAG: hypothetical protein MSA15_21255 [Clostridium sp.]|nr:hypothetical protein [Clostridium sp.]
MLDKVKRRLNLDLHDPTHDNLIIDLIEQNRDYILMYLGVSELNDTRVDSIVYRMTVESFNMLGEEGKKTAIYSDYRMDMQAELISPYRTILKALKDELNKTIRFIY